jgi:DHA1 family inner membrane transport protein
MSVSSGTHPELRLALVLFSAASGIVVATEFIVVGLLPVLAQNLSVSLAHAGRLVSAFAVSAAVLGPLLTLAATSQPPRRVLAATLLLFAAGNVLSILFPHFWMLLTVRVLQGAALPVFISVGTATVSALTVPGQRARALALANNGFVIGVVAAMPAGVALANDSKWWLPFLLLAILAVGAALLVLVRFPTIATSQAPTLTEQVSLLFRALFISHLLLSVSVFAAMFAAYTYLSAWLREFLGLDGHSVALTLAGFGLAGLIGNAIVMRRGDRAVLRTTVIGVCIATLAALGLSVSRSGWLVAILLTSWGIAHTAVVTLCQVRVTLAGGATPAFAMSMNISAANLGIALGALVGGLIVERAGINAMGWGTAALFSLVAAMAVAVRALSTRPITKTEARNAKPGSRRRCSPARLASRSRPVIACQKIDCSR